MHPQVVTEHASSQQGTGVKRICFAGLTGAELDGLQPPLSRMAAAWHCEFCPDAESAGLALTSGPTDALVLHLNRDGITDPSRLLDAVLRQPGMLRFVVGGGAERELIINSAGGPHQFVARPWKPHDLISTLERSFALQGSFAPEKVRAFLPRLGSLPGIASPYFELLRQDGTIPAHVSAAADIISRDRSLADGLMQMVNSPAFGSKERIATPADAISKLGLGTVKSLILCQPVYSALAGAKETGVPMEQLWRHAFAVARLASSIVLHCISSSGMAEEAFTAGLLHNIGQIILAGKLPQEYAAVAAVVRRQKCPLAKAEEEYLGITSGQLGAYLLSCWGMPLSLVEAAALHLAPGAVQPADFTLLTVVHVADVLAYEDHGVIGKIPPPKLDAAYLATLDLPQKTGAWSKLLAAPAGPPPPVAPPKIDRPAPKPISEFGTVQPKPVRFKMAAALALVIAGLVILGIVRKGGTETVPTVTSATAMETKSGAVPSPEPAPAEPAEDPVKLQSILFQAGHPLAIINGHPMETGGHWNGIEVVSITPSNVVVSRNHQRKTLSLK